MTSRPSTQLRARRWWCIQRRTIRRCDALHWPKRRILHYPPGRQRQPPHRGHSPSVARARHRRPRGRAALRGSQPIAARCPRCRGRGGVLASRLRRYPTYRSPSCALGRGSPPREITEYRFYLTNIDPDSLDAQCVAQTYAARWQIELIFKELKSHYRLDELPTSKAYIVETLLLGAVITLLVSRRLLRRPYAND